MSASRAEIGLITGERVTVEGGAEEVEKELSDAARSGKSRLAWFDESGTGSKIGINPGQVVSLRSVDGSGPAPD